MAFYDNSPDLVDDIAPVEQPKPDEKTSAEPERDELTGGYIAPESKDQPQQRDAKPGEPELPDAVRELRDAPERHFYDVTKMYDGVDFDQLPEDAPAEQRDAAMAFHREIKNVFADLSMTTQEANDVTQLFRKAEAEPPSEEQQAEWQQQAVDRLKREFGSEAAAALADAHKLAARDPRVLQAILTAGLASNPDLVLQFAHKARSERLAGRLK